MPFNFKRNDQSYYALKIRETDLGSLLSLIAIYFAALLIILFCSLL